PHYLLTLPAKGRQLALPFMVYGVAACAVFWALSWAALQVPSVATRIGPLRLLVFSLPFDALLDAGLVVWAQATLWSSFSRPLGRVLAAVGVFAAYCGMWALVRVDVLIPTSAAIAIACALLAAGFVVGLRAVERARWAA